MDDVPGGGLEENSVVQEVLKAKRACEEMTERRRRARLQEYFKRMYGAVNPDPHSDPEENERMSSENVQIRRKPQGVSESGGDGDVFDDLGREEMDEYYKEVSRVRRGPQRATLLDDLEKEVRESMEQTGILDEFATEW